MLQSRFIRYAIAVLAIADAVGLTWLLWPVLQPAVALFFAAVMVAAWFGGFGPGLLAGVLAAAAAEVLFTDPEGPAEISVRAVVRLGVFLATAVLISGLNSRRRTAEAGLRRAHVELERRVADRTAELSAANDRLREEVAERQAAEREILAHEARLRELASELALAEERQLRRVAAELHDGVGQLLAAAQIQVDLLRHRLAWPGGPGERGGPGALEDLGELLEAAIGRTRSLTVEFSPPVLYEAGLEPALRWLAGVASERHGLRIDVDSDGREPPLAEELRQFLFQAVRELLANVAKHARTDEATVALRTEGGEVYLTVADEGAGFDPREAAAPHPAAIGARAVGRHSFGLFNVRERLRHHGGRLLVDAAPGRGSRFTLVLPAGGDGAPEGPGGVPAAAAAAGTGVEIRSQTGGRNA